MNSDDKFFKDLKRKIEIDASKNFDHNFWSRFDNEYSKASTKSRNSIFNFKMLVPTGALATFLVVGALSYNNYQAERYSEDVAIVSKILEVELILKEENFELLGEIDNMKLTDEEWVILVGDAS
jgi:hypothetical protein